MTDLALYPKDPSYVGCWRCRTIYFTSDVGEKSVGSASFYESVHRPVSGWTLCAKCKKEMRR